MYAGASLHFSSTFHGGGGIQEDIELGLRSTNLESEGKRFYEGPNLRASNKDKNQIDYSMLTKEWTTMHYKT